MSLPFEEGGLPESARKRVEEAAANRSFFTTTCTVSELAVARLAGYEPLGQVLGSSFYHTGWSFTNSYSGGEIDVLSRAQSHARQLALGRMAEEARILGAHAVVGVELKMRGYEWAGELSEFTAIGTAVRVAGAPPPARPALSNLTVQQLYKLELAGLWPIDVVLGCCTWLDPHADCSSDGSWFNQELSAHTRCIAAAQESATARLKHEATARQALGTVGMTVERRFHEHEYDVNDSSHTAFRAEILLLGTAVCRRREPRLPRPRLVLDLGDRKIDLNQE